jgi:hypothetical protein
MILSTTFPSAHDLTANKASVLAIHMDFEYHYCEITIPLGIGRRKILNALKGAPRDAPAWLMYRLEGDSTQLEWLSEDICVKNKIHLVTFANDLSHVCVDGIEVLPTLPLGMTSNL